MENSWSFGSTLEKRACCSKLHNPGQNLDEENLWGIPIYNVDASPNRMLVGAPWDGTTENRKGDVYKCIVGARSNSSCAKVNIGR